MELLPGERNEKGHFVKGWRGGPGHPKEKTIKELVREWLDEHPNELEAFIKHFIKDNRELAWQMLEGKPTQDFTSKGERFFPIPLDDIHKDENVQEDKNDAPEN